MSRFEQVTVDLGNGATFHAYVAQDPSAFERWWYNDAPGEVLGCLMVLIFVAVVLRRVRL